MIAQLPTLTDASLVELVDWGVMLGLSDRYDVQRIKTKAVQVLLNGIKKETGKASPTAD